MRLNSLLWCRVKTHDPISNTRVSVPPQLSVGEGIEDIFEINRGAVSNSQKLNPRDIFVVTMKLGIEKSTSLFSNEKLRRRLCILLLVVSNRITSLPAVFVET